MLTEELAAPQTKRAAVMVGRLNPPTAGHYKCIDKMKTFIRENPELNLAVPVLVIVAGEKTSQDKKTNPLTAEERVKFIEASGRANGVKILTARSGFEAFNEVRKAGFEPIAVAAGSDSADNYIKLLDENFIGKDGNKIKHVKIDGLERLGKDGGKKENTSAMEAALEGLKEGGELDVAEVSGSMARRAVELGYEEEFAQIVGLEEKPRLAKLMFDKVKASLGGPDGAT